MRRTGWTVSAGAALIGAAAAWGVVATGSADEIPKQAARALPRPVVNAHELMEVFHEPYFEFLKEAMQQEPADAKGWRTLKRRGIQAAELANLTALRDVEAEHREEWASLTRDAQQAGLDLAHAAAAKDWAQTQQAYQALVRNCNDCHQRTAPDKAPELEP